MSLRVLVADDAVLFRRAIADTLASLPDVDVVGTVSNGKLAVQRVKELKPDLLTLDLEMPEMDGLAVLEVLRAANEPVIVIVVSALTRRGGQLTLRALERGAFDFITKPDSGNAEANRDALKAELSLRVRAVAQRLEVRQLLRGGMATRPKALGPAPIPPPMPETFHAPARVGAHSGLASATERMTRLAASSKPEMALIGVSTGGPNALARLLPALPGDLGVPVLIVQHMPPLFTASLAESLSSRSAIPVKEAEHGETLAPNTAYIAPGGRHMRIAPATDRGVKVVQITDDPPENNCRPAVDYLFRSVAAHFPGRAVAAILTGMGSDGTLGLRLLKRHGCFVIAQDEASCVVYGMPKAAVEAGVVDAVLPLDAIASRLTSAVRGLLT
jgi:two-component system chemotaxis response regulator CheB